MQPSVVKLVKSLQKFVSDLLSPFSMTASSSLVDSRCLDKKDISLQTFVILLDWLCEPGAQRNKNKHIIRVLIFLN